MSKITKRKDGRYAIKIYLGNVDGKPKYKSVYAKTQKEAEAKARKIKAEIEKGIDIALDGDTFKQWADRWLKIKESEVSTRWYQNYEGYINRLEDLSDTPIKKIKTADIQNIILDLAKDNPRTHKPTSRRTLKGYKDTIAQIMQLAIDNRVMDYNPANAVKLPSNAPKERRRALNKEEQEWIINTPHRAQRAAMIMMLSGLRRGELIPLTWADIDLEQRTIRVNKAIEMIGGHPKIKTTTKTESGMRTVNIPNLLADFLKDEQQKDRRDAAKNHKTAALLVCPSVSGGMLSDTAWRRMWESYLVDLNFKYGNQMDKKGNVAKSKYNSNGIVLTIPNITAHWLRHTFATMLYLSGVDVLTAKDQLGHADIKTTLDIYTHLDKEYKNKNICKLDEYLSKRA